MPGRGCAGDPVSAWPRWRIPLPVLIIRPRQRGLRRNLTAFPGCSAPSWLALVPCASYRALPPRPLSRPFAGWRSSPCSASGLARVFCGNVGGPSQGALLSPCFLPSRRRGQAELSAVAACRGHGWPVSPCFALIRYPVPAPAIPTVGVSPAPLHGRPAACSAQDQHSTSARDVKPRSAR